MLLAGANVLVVAHREDAPHHAVCREWLEALVNGPESFGVCELVLSGFLRIVTHPKVFAQPSPLADALAFAEQLRGRPNGVVDAPGARRWAIFQSLCVDAGTKGKLVADAYLAAMAIEAGCEWITTDRDFSRFKSLRWRHPQQQTAGANRSEFLCRGDLHPRGRRTASLRRNAASGSSPCRPLPPPTRANSRFPQPSGVHRASARAARPRSHWRTPKSSCSDVHRAPQAAILGFGMLYAHGKRLPDDFRAARLLRPAKGRR